MVVYRWLTNDEIVNEVNPICARRGWALLNVNDAQPTCRVLGAFDEFEGGLIGFMAFSLMPMIGSLWVQPDHRDGTVSRELAVQMHQFLKDADARGFIAVADHPVTSRICERFGMVKMEAPVYSFARSVEG